MGFGREKSGNILETEHKVPFPFPLPAFLFVCLFVIACVTLGNKMPLSAKGAELRVLEANKNVCG